MKRNEVQIQDKWRTEDIFETEALWEKELSALNKQSVEILRFKGKLGQKQGFIDCMKKSEELDSKAERLYVYAMLRADENGADDKLTALESRAKTVLTDYNAAASYIVPELSGLDERTLEAYIADPELKEHAYALREIVRRKRHILSAGEERLLAMGGTTFGGFKDVFSMIDSVDMPFPKIDMGNGKKEQLTHGTYAKCLQNTDVAVRKRAFEGMYKALGSLMYTLAANYGASVIKDNFLAAARGYNSALEKSLRADNVPLNIYKKLIATVGKNLSAVHDYIALRKQVLNVETLHMYDLYLPLVPDTGYSPSYEDAFDWVVKGLKPLGEEYTALLNRAKTERWIDVYETENKRSGAYSCGIYSVHPYVLLNYSATTHDVFTIAHELGHSLHSFYSSKTQTYANADYSIFVAEVASTVNEVLLLKYLYNKATGKEEKAFLLSYYLDMFRTTLFRQTMFAEFELLQHDAAQKGKALTKDSMSKDYLKLNKKYYGKSVKHDRQIAMEWARIPHFYNAFYVYKYATGITSAVVIAADILKNGEPAVARYKQFLSAGGSKSPYDILCDAGVDLCTDEPYETAMNEFADTLAALKKLVG